MKNFKAFLKSRNLFFLIFLILFCSLGISFFYFFGPYSRIQNIASYKENQKNILKHLQQEKEKYTNDIYGGTTPLETYRMFLEALKKEDIDLAIKYFPLDLQKKYKDLFLQIKNSGQWEKMMKDLLKAENQVGDYLADDWYNIKIKNDKNEIVTTVTLKIIKDFEGKPVNNIWKIIEF
ncbi:MAG: hypothetical protein ACP5OX_00930 [Minisyncoccia bacterium]